LGMVGQGVTANGLGGAGRPLLPSGESLPALLATAAIAAVLANVINNLPAVLVLLPLAAPSGAGAVLAVLLGVNIGPNLTYTGSLATLLWRRVLRQHGSAPDLGESPGWACSPCRPRGCSGCSRSCPACGSPD